MGITKVGRWVGGSVGIATLTILSACISDDHGAPSAHSASVAVPLSEVEAPLTAGMKPASFKRRLLRTFIPVDGHKHPPLTIPYDVAKATEGEQARAAEAEMQQAREVSGWPTEAPAGTRRLRFVDLERNEEFEEEYATEEIAAIWETAKERGLYQAPTVADSVDGDFALPALGTQGLSNTIDSRQAKPINATWPIGDAVLQRFGQVNRGCSGVLVGRRLVLTAAHCVVPSNLVITTQAYRARASGTAEPYGVQNSSGYWYDAQYASNNCHITYTTANRETCGKWDWALLLLPSTAWTSSPNGTPGWAGYWIPNAATLTASAHLRVDGYPGCGLSYSPSSCTSNTLYGDWSSQHAFNFRGPDPGDGNANTVFNYGGDTNPGTSGSPVWSGTWPQAAGSPYVMGIWTNEFCGSCTEPGLSATDKQFPNMNRAMTPWLAGFISSNKVSYP